MRMLIALMLSVMPAITSAAEIRLYTIDKFDRQESVNLWGRQDDPGCHNLRREKEIFRIAVIGKGACAIYSAADCKPDSKIAAQWKGREDPTTLLTPGARWEFGDREKIVTIEAEVDDVATEKEAPADVVKLNGDKLAKNDGEDEKLEHTFIDTGTEEKVTEPREVALHIENTMRVKSWQCVDRY